MNELFLDEEGYNQFMSIIDSLTEEGLANATFGSDAIESAVGDGWHDNFAYEESIKKSRSIGVRLQNMLLQKKFIKIISNSGVRNDCVRIGDLIEIEIDYKDGNIEKDVVLLTGNYQPDLFGKFQEITINSPIGNSIFKKKIGSIVKCTINGKEVSIKILKKESRS